MSQPVATAVAAAPATPAPVAAAASTPPPQVASAPETVRQDTTEAGAPIPSENPLRASADSEPTDMRGRLGRLLGMFSN